MGEKQGKGGDDKEKSAAKAEGGGGGDAKKNNKQDNSGGGDGKKKKDDGTLTVVLKVEMHCDGCAKKIRRFARSFDGVEMATADASTGKLTAVGKVDPWKLREHLEVKTHKKVVLVSPTDAPKKKDEGKKDDTKDGDKGKGGGEKKEQKAPKESTVVLKIHTHCDGCRKRIRRTILRFQGVSEASVDDSKDLVTVKGTMEVKSLVPYLQDKLKRNVEAVQPKKDDGGKGGGGGKGGDGEKKKEGGGGGGDDKDKAKAAAQATEANKLLFGGYGAPAGMMMYAAPPPEFGGHAGYQFLQQPQGFPVPQQQMYLQQQQYPHVGPQFNHIPHPPQMFSDENPNACSIM